MRLLFVPAAFLLLQGCVAQMAADVVTAPFKIASKGVDLMTTSESESDQKRGKRLREKEEELGRLAVKRDKAVRKCAEGDTGACEKAQKLEAEYEEVESRRV